MSSLTNKYINNRSMNGLINIYADNIETTNSIVNDSLIVNGTDISETTTQVETNKTNLTGITYTATPTPTTRIVNNIDITGQMNIRDPTNTNHYIRFYHDIAQYGYIFQLETPNQIMYFKVKNGTTPGQYKTFYFAAGQLYANMLAYIDNTLTVSFNNNLVLGDANPSVWIGSAMKYVPNSAVTSGLVFYNKGLNNNTAYYTNFTHNNLSNVEVPTLRMNYNNIWSKVAHTMESTLTLQNNLIVNSTNITPLELSYLSGVTSNIQTQLNSKLTTLNPVISGDLTVNGTSNLNGLNSQATSCTSLTVTGNALCDGFTARANATIMGNLTVLGSSSNNISGPTTMTGSLNVQNTITTNNNITQNGTTATTNKFIQPIILGDVTGNPNTLKYTQFKINSNSATGTPYPTCLMIDDFNSRGIQFISNASLYTLNPLVSLNDSVIGPLVLNNSSLVLTNYGTIKSGLKISCTTSTNANVELYCKDSYIKMNSSSVLQSLDISAEILNHTATSGYQLTSPEVFIQTTNDLYPCKYRALTHEFSKKDGTSGCVIDVKGSIKFPSGQSQTDAWNSTNAGYTKSGTTISFANNTNLTLTTGGQITFSNGTIQSTAFRNDDNTKLQAIGTITSSSLSATTTLTSGSFFNCGSLSLSGGTYMLTLNCCFSIITGSTTVSQLLMALSTSSNGLSTNNHLSIIHAGGINYAVNNQWVLTSSAIIEVALTTTYYMVCQPSFGTASRMQFNNGNSFFRAVRIA